MAEEITDEFTCVDLKDLRRNRRLAKVVTAMNKSPAASISAACGGWSETMGAYRLLGSPEVKPEALLAPHQRSVAARCAGHACVVVAQDTTEFDFSHMKELTGTGPLNELSRRGFFMHSLYAVSEQGLPLGVLGAEMIIRSDETFHSAASRKQKPIEEKESGRWWGWRRAALRNYSKPWRALRWWGKSNLRCGPGRASGRSRAGT